MTAWILKCHDNGLQIYAWMNPFRTDWPVIIHAGEPDEFTLPFFASSDGNHLYLDPTSPDVQNYLGGLVQDFVDSYLVVHRPTTTTMMMKSMKKPATSKPFATSREATKKVRKLPATTPDMPKAMAKASTERLKPKPRTRAMVAARVAAATTQPGDEDGIDGVVVDHYFPDPNNPMVRATQGGRQGGPQGAPKMMTLAANGNTADCSARKVNPPTPRIKWLLTKHGMPQPPGNKTMDEFIEMVFHVLDNADLIFGISPCAEQTTLAENWLAKGWCHYFMPELYQHPADFEAALDYWISKNVEPDPTNHPGIKPLLTPVLYSAAVERADSTGTIWPAAEIEQEINYAHGKQVGQIHYTWRAMRKHAHGGPPNDHNVGDDVQGNQYKDKALIPAAMRPALGLSDPKVTPAGPGQIKITMTNGEKVFQWAYSLLVGGVWQDWKTADGRKPILNKGGATRIRIQAVDKHNSKSAVKDLPV
jgi:hypothetical protein